VWEHFFYLTHGYYLNDGSGKEHEQLTGYKLVAGSKYLQSKARLIFSF